MSGPISDRIRSNIWGVAACFIALMGTAVVASASDEDLQSTKSASSSNQVKKLKKRLASVEQRLAALEGKPGATIPTSLPPSGPAGGELAGDYPSPTIGTASGLDLASSTSPAAGINFGADTNLYRIASDELWTDDTLGASGGLIVGGSEIVLGGSPNATVFLPGWLRLSDPSSEPPTTECDQSFERGRLVYRSATNELWVCDDSGWLQILAS